MLKSRRFPTPALRGHRDDGQLEINSAITGDQGVFRSLLAFRLDSGDEILREHLENCTKNATMISKTVQNEIIEVIHEVLVNNIVTNVKKLKYFSILCDETTDISTKEQITFSVRYVDMEKYIIKEDFLGFTELFSTTGISIKQVILKKLNDFGLSLANRRGQGYDGGSNMSGVHNGVQALILEEQPLALYTHCFSHGLNLAISKACEIPAIRNMFGIVGSVSVFLSSSAKRNNTLIRVISNDSTESHPNKIKLKALCETRWVERHNSIITFHDLYKFILIALEELEKDSNRETSYKAANFNSSVRRSEFLVSLEIVANLFAYTKSLSIQLQSSKQDLSMAKKNIKNIIALFNNIRENPEDIFDSLFENAAKKAQMFGEKIKIPRLCGQQTQRSNIIVREPMDWFKVTIFIPFLDHIIHGLDSRFNEKFNNIIALEGLIPANINFYDTKSVLESTKFYCEDIEGSDLELKAEIHLWKNKWTNIQNNSQTAVEALEYCNEFFPNIKILLQIFTTLPVSTATAERSFSTLRRLKNYLRSTMSEVRLNGLAMLNIHKEIDINQVVDTFAQKKKRRMELEDWSKLSKNCYLFLLIDFI
ncbi:hypothetical protein QTP88_023199 [Uroleucon formosanum]